MEGVTKPAEVYVHVCYRCSHVYDRVTGKPTVKTELSIPPDLRISGECKDCNDKTEANFLKAIEANFLQAINDSIKKETQ